MMTKTQAAKTRKNVTDKEEKASCPSITTHDQPAKNRIPHARRAAETRAGDAGGFYQKDIYGKLMEKNEGKPLFILHDGPRSVTAISTSDGNE
jgi:hypothetical protein